MEGWNVLSPLWRFQSAVFESISHELARHRLHAKSLAVLDALAMHHYPNEVAKALRVPMPTLSNILRELERNGYIHRDVDEADRRRVIVRRTAEGEEAHRLCIRVVDRQVNKWLSAMDPHQAQAVSRAAENLTATLAIPSNGVHPGPLTVEPSSARLR